MAQHAEDLIAQLNKRFPEREFHALVADLKGNSPFMILKVVFTLFRRDAFCNALHSSDKYSE